MFKSAGLGIWLFINISVYCFDFFILQRKLRKTDLYNVNSLIYIYTRYIWFEAYIKQLQWYNFKVQLSC